MSGIKSSLPNVNTEAVICGFCSFKIPRVNSTKFWQAENTFALLKARLSWACVLYELQNAKIEFVYDAVLNNFWGSDYFSWIDFSIAYLLRDKPRSLLFLKMLKFFIFQIKDFKDKIWNLIYYMRGFSELWNLFKPIIF